MPHSSLCCLFYGCAHHRDLHSFPTRRSSDLLTAGFDLDAKADRSELVAGETFHVTTSSRCRQEVKCVIGDPALRSEEHTSELQSRGHLVCRLLREKKKRIH